MELEAAHQTQENAEGKPKSFLSRLGGVYTAPRATFAEIGRSPGVLVPIIVLAILSMLVTFLVAQRVDMRALAVEQIEKLAENNNIPPEQLEIMKQRTASSSQLSSLISSPILSLLVVLVIAGVGKLITVLKSSDSRFKALLAVTLYVAIAMMIVERALYLLILFLKDPAELTLANINSLVASNLGSWIAAVLGNDALPKYAMSLAEQVDIFAIAKIALLAIGYSAVSVKLKTSSAAVWLSVLYIIFALIAAALGSFLR